MSKKADKYKRSDQIIIKLTLKEKEKIKENSKEKGMSVSDYVRYKILSGTGVLLEHIISQGVIESDSV